MRRAVLFYGLFVGIIFAPFLFAGEIFVPGDFLAFIYPWRAYQTEFPHNMELFDVAVFFLPQDIFYNASLKAGHLPLWNPQIFSGHPAVASGQSGFLYPPRAILHSIFSTGVAKTWIQLSHLFGMGLAMYAFLKVRKFDEFPCLLGGLIWMGNTYVMSWLEMEHAAIAGLFLPLLLLCLEKALGGSERWWCALPVLGALSLHSGHLQMNLYTGSIFIVYSLLRLWQLREKKTVLKFLGVGFLTVGLAAPTVLPFIDYLGESQRLPLDLQANAASFQSIVMSLLNPDLLGNPTRGFLLNRCESNLTVLEFACFVGFIPLVLVISARGKQARALQALSLACLLVASASFSISLPFLNRFVPGRILYVLVFCLMLLAVIGAQQMSESTKRIRLISAILGTLWLGILGFLAYLYLHPPMVLDWCAQNPGKVKLPPSGLGPEVLWTAFENTYLWNPQLLTPLLATAALVFWPQKKNLLLGVTLLELAMFGAGFNTHVPPDSLNPMTPEIQAMVSTEGRVMAVECANYNTLTPYGLSLISGYESLISKRYALAMAQANPERPLPMRSLSLKRLDLPMVDALSVEYALLSPLTNLSTQGWELTYEGKGGKVYRNTEALPRALLLGKVRPLQTLEQLQDFNPGEEAFVSAPPPMELEASAGSVKWLTDSPNVVELEIQTDTAQLLLLTDSYDAGWKCQANGVEIPVHTANLASRGVYLGPGTTHLRFSFEPASLKLGIQLCLLTACLTFVWFGLSFRKA